MGMRPCPMEWNENFPSHTHRFKHMSWNPKRWVWSSPSESFAFFEHSHNTHDASPAINESGTPVIVPHSCTHALWSQPLEPGALWKRKICLNNIDTSNTAIHASEDNPLSRWSRCLWTYTGPIIHEYFIDTSYNSQNCMQNRHGLCPNYAFTKSITNGSTSIMAWYTHCIVSGESGSSSHRYGSHTSSPW